MTVYWLHLLLTKDHEDFKRMAMNRSFPRTDTRFDAVCTTTSENIDQPQRRIQFSNLSGLEHMSMVKNHVVE